MWRSIATTARASSLTKHGGRKLSSYLQNPNQVLCKTLISPPSSSSFSTIPFSRTFISQCPRFFSHSSTDPTDFEPEEIISNSNGNTHGEFDIESSVSEEINESYRGSSLETLEFRSDFDGSDGNSDVNLGDLGSVDVVDVGKLENVLSLLQSTVDGSLESSLDRFDLRLNEEFVVRVLETPLVPGEHLIRFFKWGLSKEEFAKAAALDALVRAICSDPKKKEVYALWDLVKEMGERETGLMKAEILNEVISALSKLGKGKAAFEVFGKYEEFGCVPNPDTYYLTIEALCRRNLYDWASSVCQQMVDSGMLPDSEKIGGIVSFLCKGHRAKEAYVVYLSAKEKSRHLPQRAINFLIICLSKGDETVQLAQQMLGDISNEARKRASDAFSYVIRGLCRTKDTDSARKLLYEMIEKGPPPGNGVFNSIISSLSKSGDLEDAKEILRLMESRGLKPDVYTYSVIMSGYTKGGMMDEACKVLSEAKRKHSKLCPVTYHTLIRGYCKLGEFDKALKLLSEMKDYGVEPSVDEYNKLIQSLCLKALDWGTAEKLLAEMKEKGLYLPGITRGLIRAVKELENETLRTEESIKEVQNVT